MRADVMAARLDHVQSWQGYRELLRELHVSSGAPKYGTLTAASGLAKSAISGLIGTNPVQRPSEGTSLRFVEACLLHARNDPDDVAAAVAAWRATWQRLKAADEGAADAPVAGSPPPALPPSPARGLHRRVGVLAAAGGVVAVGVGTSIWLAQPSPAQAPRNAPSLAAAKTVAGCTQAPADQPDARLHRRWDSVFVCPTHRAFVYEWAAVSGAPIGYLKSDPSWIVCWTRGETEAGSNVWYYTQGDDLLGKAAFDAWGFIRAADVPVAQHPDPGMTRRCPFPTRPGTAGG